MSRSVGCRSQGTATGRGAHHAGRRIARGCWSLAAACLGLGCVSPTLDPKAESSTRPTEVLPNAGEPPGEATDEAEPPDEAHADAKPESPRGEAAPDNLWRRWAEPPEGYDGAGLRFVPTEHGAWRCFGARCEVLDRDGKRLTVRDFPCSSVGLNLFVSPRRVFAATRCGDDLIIVALADGARRKVRLPRLDIRSVVVDDDGTTTLSVLPFGELVRVGQDGKTERISVVAPRNEHDPAVSTFIMAAHAPWLAFTAGAAGGEKVWTRADPAHPLQGSDNVFFSGALCWAVSRHGEVWRVEPEGATKKLATRLPIDEPRSSAGPWGQSGFAFTIGLHRIELRGPDLELEASVELPEVGLLEISPSGDRLYLVRGDGSVDVRPVPPPAADQ